MAVSQSFCSAWALPLSASSPAKFVSKNPFSSQSIRVALATLFPFFCVSSADSRPVPSSAFHTHSKCSAEVGYCSQILIFPCTSRQLFLQALFLLWGSANILACVCCEC